MEVAQSTCVDNVWADKFEPIIVRTKACVENFGKEFERSTGARNLHAELGQRNLRGDCGIAH